MSMFITDPLLGFKFIIPNCLLNIYTGLSHRQLQLDLPKIEHILFLDCKSVSTCW